MELYIQQQYDFKVNVVAFAVCEAYRINLANSDQLRHGSTTSRLSTNQCQLHVHIIVNITCILLMESACDCLPVLY